jgi:hypothetical protein
MLIATGPPYSTDGYSPGHATPSGGLEPEEVPRPSQPITNQLGPPCLRGVQRPEHNCAARSGEPLLAKQMTLNAVQTTELSVKRPNASRKLWAHRSRRRQNAAPPP